MSFCFKKKNFRASIIRVYFSFSLWVSRIFGRVCLFR